MKPSFLKLHAVGTKLINDHDALIAGTCRYIGRRWDAELKGWPATEEPSKVRPLSEYVMAVKHGDLIPADKETADYCSVPFAAPAPVSSANIGQTSFNGKF